MSSYEDNDCRGGYDEINLEILNSMKVHLCVRCGENQVQFNGGMCEGCERAMEEEE